MGKPAKRNITNMGDKAAVNRPGKPVLYIGTAGAVFECPDCKRTMGKGIVYENNSKLYCSRNCIESALLAS